MGEIKLPDRFTAIKKDLGFYSLIVSNLIPIVFVVIYKISFLNVLWVYWFQSLIICLFTVAKMMSLKRFTTKDINPPMKENSPGAKIGLSMMMLFITLFFHGIYTVFLSFAFPMITGEIDIAVKDILIGAAVFFIHYLISFINGVAKDNREEKVYNIGSFFMPMFFSILPIHVSIIIGGFVLLPMGNNTTSSMIIIIFFLLLKTGIDLFIHSQKHRKAYQAF